MLKIVFNEVEMGRFFVLRQVKEYQLTKEEAEKRLGLTS